MSRSRQPATRSSLHTTTEPPQGPSTHLPQTIRLRGDNTTPTTTSPDPPSSRRIQWSEDVIDNEGMGKKSSKVCCIYHKARPVGESSSEESSSSSSSDSDSDSEAEQRRQRLSRVRGRGRRDADRPEGEGQEGEGEGEGCCSGEHHHSRSKIKRRKPSPNAYEKMPKPSKNHGRGV